MTRDEIIRELKYVIEQEKGKTYDTFSTNVRAMAQDCLRFIEEQHNPPLDENGLARCGCGGRLALHKMPESNYDSVEDKPVFFVNCSNDDCSLFFGYYHFAEDAIKAANRAMGVKETTHET